jgi:hypothetical protein
LRAMSGPDGRVFPADVSWSPFFPWRRNFIAMRIIRVSTSAFAAALLIVAFGSSPSEAGLVTTVTPTITPQGGTFLYNYQVANDPVSTVGVAEFDLAVTVDSSLTSLTAPTGFLSLYTTGDSFVQFLSTDSSFDIAPGASGIFSFISPLAPGIESDLTAGFDASSGARFEDPGATLGPASPEPSTLVLLATGSAVLAVVKVRRRRK